MRQNKKSCNCLGISWANYNLFIVRAISYRVIIMKRNSATKMDLVAEEADFDVWLEQADAPVFVKTE